MIRQALLVVIVAVAASLASAAAPKAAAPAATPPPPLKVAAEFQFTLEKPGLTSAGIFDTQNRVDDRQQKTITGTVRLPAASDKP